MLLSEVKIGDKVIFNERSNKEYKELNKNNNAKGVVVDIDYSMLGGVKVAIIDCQYERVIGTLVSVNPLFIDKAEFGLEDISPKGFIGMQLREEGSGQTHTVLAYDTLCEAFAIHDIDSSIGLLKEYSIYGPKEPDSSDKPIRFITPKNLQQQIMLYVADVLVFTIGESKSRRDTISTIETGKTKTHKIQVELVFENKLIKIIEVDSLLEAQNLEEDIIHHGHENTLNEVGIDNILLNCSKVIMVSILK